MKLKIFKKARIIISFTFICSFYTNYGKGNIIHAEKINEDTIVKLYVKLLSDSNNIPTNYGAYLNFLPTNFIEYGNVYQYLEKKELKLSTDSSEFIDIGDIYSQVIFNIKYGDTLKTYETIVRVMKNCSIKFSNYLLASCLENYLSESENNYISFFNFLEKKDAKLIQDFFVFVLGRSTYSGLYNGEHSTFKKLEKTHPKIYKEMQKMIKKYPPNKP